MSSRVTVDSKLTVVSSKPIRSGMTHTLSAVDHLMGHHSLHVVFYYENEENLLESFELDSLRESLCEVLTVYPTMTGRLTRDVDGKWEVRCNDAGVRVIKANVDTTLGEWLKSASDSEQRSLIAWDDMPEDPHTWSPFRIQINSFQEGGLAIGLSCTHMLADLTFAASFFKSWTETHRHKPITYPPFFTPLPKPHIHYAAKTTTMSPQQAKTPSSENMASTTFKFTSSIIKQCLSNVQGTCPDATPFDFLSALFWTRISRLKPSKNRDQARHSLSICTDFRRFLQLPLPIGFFGNALHFSTLSVEEDMESGDLGGIASAVHSHLAGLAEEEIWSSVEWLESQKESEGGKLRSPSCMYGPELTCVCMEHMVEAESSLLYTAMFSNNEKPVHVSCHLGKVEGEGLIMVMPSSEGGLARTVTVMLPEEEIGELRKDKTILQLEPTVVLAGCGVDH